MLEAMADYMRQGGVIMYPILFVSVVVWYIGLLKLYQIMRFRRERRRFLDAVGSYLNGGALDYRGDEHFESLAQDVRRGHPLHGNYFATMYRQFLMETVPSLESTLPTLASWISAAPLLGLLGTVTGMIETFRNIMLYGVGNPVLTAEGISVALLTTQAGLMVAFPALLMHNFLHNAKEKTVARLMMDGEDILNRIRKTGWWKTVEENGNGV